MAYEKPNYKVLQSDKPFEVRHYPGYLQASVVIEDDFENSGNKAFRILFAYISGSNTPSQNIPMTIPVTQETISKFQKIMATSATQQKEKQGYKIAFVMPAKWTLKTLPQPKDQRIQLEEVPSRTVAVVRYSGSWSRNNFEESLSKLHQWMEKKNLKATGNPIWARYNSPFTLWFLRRNEIHIPIKS